MTAAERIPVFPPEPFPLRFDTLEAAQEFQAAFEKRVPTREMNELIARLSVPPFIEIDGVGQCNPAYEEAVYEWALVPDNQSR